MEWIAHLYYRKIIWEPTMTRVIGIADVIRWWATSASEALIG